MRAAESHQLETRVTSTQHNPGVAGRVLLCVVSPTCTHLQFMFSTVMYVEFGLNDTQSSPFTTWLFVMDT